MARPTLLLVTPTRKDMRTRRGAASTLLAELEARQRRNHEPIDFVRTALACALQADLPDHLLKLAQHYNGDPPYAYGGVTP